jgi:hypothetical protein
VEGHVFEREDEGLYVIDFAQFLCILMVEAVGVVDYFDGLPDDV